MNKYRVVYADWKAPSEDEIEADGFYSDAATHTARFLTKGEDGVMVDSAFVTGVRLVSLVRD